MEDCDGEPYDAKVSRTVRRAGYPFHWPLLYVLSTLYKESETSTKAGLKYFLLGGLSSCIILLGCGLIYSYTGLTNFESIYTIISTSNSISCFNNSGIELTYNASAAIQGLSLGLVFIFIGFLFKIAAAPLHNWSPAMCFRKTLLWVKLSNSGDTLKFRIPNLIRKNFSGQNNYLGMVTSPKMKEIEMGYHGSKSGILPVKEQRVDGSWFLANKARSLRCTLMGGESRYQFKVLSNQLNSPQNLKKIYWPGYILRSYTKIFYFK